MGDSNILRIECFANVAGKNIPISIWKPLFPKKHRKHMILIIYGGSKDFDQTKLREIKAIFAEEEYCVAGFDFRGIAPNTGAFEESGLTTRIKDAEAVFAQLITHCKGYSFTIFGVSMGGYIASFLLKHREVEIGILVAPGAYHNDAIEKNICFGERFTELIRTEGGWKNSRSFDEIANFGGSLLVVQFQNDEVVASQITQRYYDVAPPTPDKDIITLPYGHGGSFHGKKLKDITDHALQWIKNAPSSESRISER